MIRSRWWIRGWGFLLASLVCISPVGAAEGKVLAIAMAFPDGGGYDKAGKGSGVPEDVVFKGKTILPRATVGTYCCGFTFAVVMRAAQQRGLLARKSVEETARFQQEWYGATKESRETQCVLAVQNLGVGAEMKLEEAQPGDFVELWRANGTGHSVVLVRCIARGGKLVGIQYRSSQGSTNGIGTVSEYFTDAGEKKGGVLRARTYVCRLRNG